MKEPTKIKEEHIKCQGCGKPIHIKELGLITKEGMYHNNVCCCLDKLRKDKLFTEVVGK